MPKGSVRFPSKYSSVFILQIQTGAVKNRWKKRIILHRIKTDRSLVIYFFPVWFMLHRYLSFSTIVTRCRVLFLCEIRVHEYKQAQS